MLMRGAVSDAHNVLASTHWVIVQDSLSTIACSGLQRVLRGRLLAGVVIVRHHTGAVPVEIIVKEAVNFAWCFDIAYS